VKRWLLLLTCVAVWSTTGLPVASAATEEHLGWSWVVQPTAGQSAAQTVRVNRPASVTGDLQYRAAGVCMDPTLSTATIGQTQTVLVAPWTANTNFAIGTAACTVPNVLASIAVLVESRTGWSVAVRWTDPSLGTGGSFYASPSPYASPYPVVTSSPVDRLVAFCDPQATPTPTASPSPSPSPTQAACDMTVTVAESQWGVIGLGIGLLVLLIAALVVSGWRS
jgi:hypothetical protein